jgi:hypothetical protein
MPSSPWSSWILLRVPATPQAIDSRNLQDGQSRDARKLAYFAEPWFAHKTMALGTCWAFSIRVHTTASVASILD